MSLHFTIFVHQAYHKDLFLENTGLKCLWNLCKFETDDRVDMLRHLDYHGYHTRLKTFGRGLVNIISIPTCHIDSKKRNDIPSILTDHFCYWDNCERSFPKFQDLIDHLGYHLVRDYQTGSSIVKAMGTNLKGIKVNCKWDQCELNLANVFQLKRHLKTHTNEKHIGCSNCGCLFSNKTLFINHCIRQAVSRESSLEVKLLVDLIEFYSRAKFPVPGLLKVIPF